MTGGLDPRVREDDEYMRGDDETNESNKMTGEILKSLLGSLSSLCSLG